MISDSNTAVVKIYINLAAITTPMHYVLFTSDAGTGTAITFYIIVLFRYLSLHNVWEPLIISN